MALAQILLLVVCLYTATNAQTVHWGPCPEVTVQQDFNVTSYMGTWYEIQKFPAAFQMMLKCTEATYELLEDSHVQVVNKGVNIYTNVATQIKGDAFVPNPQEAAKLKVKFFWWQPPGDYWVLSTDYKTYSVVYTCSDFFGLSRTEFAWVLSRERTLDADTVATIVKNMQDMGIDTSPFEVTDQTGCDGEIELGLQLEIPRISQLAP